MKVQMVAEDRLEFISWNPDLQKEDPHTSQKDRERQSNTARYGTTKRPHGPS